MRRSELIKIQKQLIKFVNEFSIHWMHPSREQWCGTYMSGLLLDGERKSMGAMAARLEGGNQQAMAQFISQSPWAWEDVMGDLRRHTIRRFRENLMYVVLDDTALPKKGNHSVGVAHQYCGALGKLANCQTVVSLMGVMGEFHIPLNAQLYLPEAWTDDPKRLNEAKVPQPYRAFKEKWRIGLDLVDEIRAEHTFEALVFDAGYGDNRVFLGELDTRGIKFVGQIPENQNFWRGDMRVDSAPRPSKGPGAPRKYRFPADRRHKPKSVAKWRKILFDDPKNIHKFTTPSGMKVEFVAIRVFEGICRPSNRMGPPRWLMIERLPDGTFKHYVSSFDEDVPPSEILRIAHCRWRIEQGYQQLKEELGLDHFEGRSWDGLHRHVTLCFMAYDFLQLLRLEQLHAGHKKKSSSNPAGHSSLDQRAGSHRSLPQMRKNLPLQARYYRHQLKFA